VWTVVTGRPPPDDLSPPQAEKLEGRRFAPRHRRRPRRHAAGVLDSDVFVHPRPHFRFPYHIIISIFFLTPSAYINSSIGNSFFFFPKIYFFRSISQLTIFDIFSLTFPNFSWVFPCPCWKIRRHCSPCDSIRLMFLVTAQLQLRHWLVRITRALSNFQPVRL